MMKAEIEAMLGHVVASSRYRWHALICTTIVCLIGWGGVYLLADQFQSRAQIYVDTKSVLKPLLQGIAVSTDTQSEADVVRRALVSRQTLEKVARQTHLIPPGKTPEEVDKLLVRLEDDIRVTGSQESGIYSIAYIHRDPHKAQQVVQSLLDTFVDSSSSANRSDTQHAEEFLEQQVKEYADRLSQTEQSLAQFKKENIGGMPGQSGGYFQRLDSEQFALEKKQEELAVALRRRNELRRKITGSGNAVGTGPIAVPTSQQIQIATEIDARLQDSRRQLDDLLLKYTEQHPTVLALRETIQHLEERRRNEVGGVRATTTSISREGKGDSVDGVLQQLQIQLDAQDLQVASLQVEVQQVSDRVANLKKLLSTGPEVEAELSRLNRDYGVTKAQYEQLQQRLETARISGRAERDPEVKFRIIDPPLVALRPVAPKRGLFLGVVLILATALGALTAFVLSQSKPVFMSVNALEKALGLPVAGTIRRVLTPTQAAAARRNRLSFIAASCLLLLAFGMAVVFSHEGSAWLHAALKGQTL